MALPAYGGIRAYRVFMDGRALDSDRRGNRLFGPVPSSVSGIGLYLEAFDGRDPVPELPDDAPGRDGPRRGRGLAEEVAGARERACVYKRGSRVLYIAEEVAAWGDSQRGGAA